MTNKFNFPRGEPGRKEEKLATSQWAEPGEDMRYASGKLWLGRDANEMPIGVEDNRHVVTVAGSRAGKGTSLIIPNLCLWQGSAVIVDPKGENAARTARERAKIPGHKVIVLDPFDESGVPETLLGSLNPLDQIDIESDEAIDLAAMIADALIVKTSDRDMHWDESSRQLIEALILHVCDTEEPEQRTLSRVRQLLVKGDAEFRNELIDEGAAKSTSAFDALWAKMAESEAGNENIADTIIGAAETVMAMGDNERGSVLSNARRSTRFLATPRIQNSLAATSFDFDELKNNPAGMSVYLCLPARYLATHSRWLRLYVSQMLHRMESMGLDEPASGQPVLFVLDEFATLGHLEMLEKAAGLMAGYGVKLWPILQDLTQLKRHYRQSWETFLGNAGMLTFFGNTDLTTLEWISKRIGETEIIRENAGYSQSTSRGSSTADGESETSGTSAQQGESASTSEMAPLSQTATIQGGNSIWDALTRRFSRSTGHSRSVSRNDGQTHQSSQSKTVTENESASEGRSRQEQIHKTPLMTTDEIARHFDRESGLQIVFVGGRGPYAIQRTPYYEDDRFHGLFTELG